VNRHQAKSQLSGVEMMDCSGFRALMGLSRQANAGEAGG
jgi:anti-anti-sigma regulatory factor